MKAAVHTNSITSYHALNLTKRQQEVVAALETLGQATDQQIADYLGYTVNRVTGRITELTTAGVVRECSRVKGEFGKTVRVCELT